jgi:hypothetical protein
LLKSRCDGNQAAVMKLVLSTAYLPPISYFKQLLNADEVIIERHEHFVKQTYRNRCHIAAANGLLSLSIPLQKLGDKESISEKRISYAEDWQSLHWRSLVSAYKSSPYFEYFEADFKLFYEKEHELLFEYNLELLKLLLKLMRIEREIKFTGEYNSIYENTVDLRNAISPKIESAQNTRSYYQVFANKNGFIPNLSIVDLLFNEGLGALELLSETT